MSQLTLGSRRGTIFVRASARRGESRDVGRVPSAASFSLGRVGARANSRQPESVAKAGNGPIPAKSVKERIPPLPLDAADRGARLRVPSRKRRVSSVDPRPAALSPPTPAAGLVGIGQPTPRGSWPQSCTPWCRGLGVSRCRGGRTGEPESVPAPIQVARTSGGRVRGGLEGECGLSNPSPRHGRGHLTRRNDGSVLARSSCRRGRR
jgi:hypothetical protein